MSEDDLLAEATLLGTALIQCQRVELALYGIAAHVTHIPSVAKNSRFKDLTGEKFLRGDPSDLKATLGVLADALGDALLLDTDELDRFVDDRNDVVHNFWRIFHWDVNGTTRRTDAREFLEDFIARSQQWTTVLLGLYTELLIAFAEKERRTAELNVSAEQEALRLLYHGHVGQRLAKTSSTTTPDP